ncbi:MAG: hypothetical protein AUJ70_01750 [Candidatus Omnitrophica bacterium CG1_02_40_15]|nr:MAG: hypothetical protein AUJ70_01750 [Candidatus Omnitrophica bacterium CG1_02_40_15]
MKLFKKIFEFKKIAFGADLLRFSVVRKVLYTFLHHKKESDFVNDRRKSKRYDIMLKLNYSYPETRYTGESFTKNISENGLRFPVNLRIAKGALMDIKIEDPNSGKYLSLRGKVRWLEEFSGEDDSGAVRYETGINLLKKRLF